MKTNIISSLSMRTITLLLLFVSGFVSADPIIGTPPPYQLCSDTSYPSSCSFFLPSMDSYVTMGQSNLVVSYHETLNDAINNLSPIPYGYYCNINPGTQTIYVRATDMIDGSFATTTLELIVHPAPIANMPPVLLHEDTPFDGISVFDLTANEALITGGASGVIVSYHTSLLDAQDEANPIATPTAYTNTTNPQTIYIRVTDPINGCFKITNSNLIVNDPNAVSNPDVVNIPDPNFKFELVYGNIATDIFGNPVVLDANGDGEIQLTEALAAYRLDTMNASVTSYEGIQSFHNLGVLYLSGGNTINSLDVSGLTNLKDLRCAGLQLQTLNITNCPALETLFCGSNNISTLDLTGKPNLRTVWCELNQITALDVTGSPLLHDLSCRNNSLTSLDLTNNTALTDLNCGMNQFTTLDVSHSTNLVNFHCAGEPVTSINMTGLTHIANLNLRYTNITSLDVSNMPNLSQLNCDGNLFTELDLSHNPWLSFFQCSNSNSLTYLNLKNGNYSWNMPTNFVIQGNSNLQFVCTDNEEAAYFENYFNSIGSNAVVNSYCTFTPGGNYNTITGVITLDNDNNGCDTSDATQPNIKVKLATSTDVGYTFSNATGSYSFYTDAGSFEWMLDTENPSWFTFSPTTATTTFADNNNNIATQHFCLAPNGNHRDVEMVIMPITVARPGFDATYKLVYKNKGNQTSDVFLNLNYNDALLSFVSASVTPTLATNGHLSWTVTDVQPFESGYVFLTLHLSPASNIGDVLNFNTFIDITTDENWADNAFTLHQTVVGSYDPNDIICFEGDLLPVTEIGRYLHYGINFENTGNYAAENVVVKDVIDTDKYDITSLQVMETSHPSYIKITGNTVEFVFENINLAAASGGPPVGGHGDVLFKIKSKNSLVNGDYVSKSAKIYFDYNAPITTNDALTTFATLNNPIHEFDNSVKVYPNPAHTVINISCNSTIQSVALYDIQGRLLETDLANGNDVLFDISGKSNGVYFIKVTSEKGSKVEKIVKE